MAKSDRSKPLAELTFRCGPCAYTFRGPPARVVDDPEQGHHPWAYYTSCPQCKHEVEQAAWERALLKAWANATGPRTPEGLAVAGKNLEGHPTPEEALRTRFNGMKHGLTARTAQYFPARPGHYPLCKACDVDQGWCASQPACVKQTQIFMLHHAAFEQRNPTHLTGIYSNLQAGVVALIQMILQIIIADGPKLESPEYYTNGDAMFVAEWTDELGQKHVIKNVQAHPLIKSLYELLSRNNLSLADMGMTIKAIEDEKEELGKLESQQHGRQLITDFMAQQSDQLKALQELVKNASANRARDPVLIEYNEEGKGG